jgi:hypothetical protein
MQSPFSVLRRGMVTGDRTTTRHLSHSGSFAALYSSAVWYDSLTRRSRPSLVSAEARTNVPDRGQGRGVARSRVRQVGSDGLREVAIAQRMPDAAEFGLAFRGMMPDRTVTTGEAFSPLAQSRLPSGQGPTPISVDIHYGPIRTHCRCFSLAQTDQGLTQLG